MRNDRVAREYAEALFEAAEEKGKVENVAEEITEILEVLLGDEFDDFFLAPNIESEQKKRVFAKAFGDVGRLVRNFFWLVFDNKREELLPAIAAEYGRLVDEYRRRVVASVTTAVALPDELAGLMRLKIEQVLGKEVILKPEVHPEIKGGYLLRIGDRVIDASLKGRLDVLRERLVGGN